MSTNLYRSISDLKGFSLKNCPSMPDPTGVLMCPPDYYAGGEPARKQWEDLKSTFETAGKPVSLIQPSEGLGDMVFCANQALVGLTPQMERLCIPSQMRHSSRRHEVPAFEAWFGAQGYRVLRLKDSALLFEGSRDAVWHPGKRLLWGGHGFLSQVEAYEEVAKAFGSPVIALKLVNEKFCRLDSCFCPLTSEAVLIYPSAFDAASLELILKMFPIVLTAGETEAGHFMACNACVLDATTAVLQRGAPNVARHMAGMGLRVIEADTSEFIKSGGSVYALKMFIY
ncbi:MAG: hypothetical protein KGO96_11175 [Elusimicrobia bacterium]|nr:hypothetical protein [Elusimicrobiota bacterium]MDE2426454.1 hypothetical protein [Elusimicrobiota bacterium]